MSMEARFFKSLHTTFLLGFALLGIVLCAANPASGAEMQLLRPSSQTRIVAPTQIPAKIALGSTQVYRYDTANFTITNAPTPEMAREFGEAAETYRRELAVLWIGQSMPNWSAKCPIKVKVGNYGASGDTTFTFESGEVYRWDMNVQGTRERILDSVLPHEISHTIFASYFRRPLPRWLDEGASTSVEHISERATYRRMLLEFVDPTVRRGIPFNRMVEMHEYPRDHLALYAQCNSVAEFLIGQGGNRRFIAFAKDGLDSSDWNVAARQHYGYDNLDDLQTVWIRWVGEGFPDIESYEPALVRSRRIQPVGQPSIPRFAMVAGL